MAAPINLEVGMSASSSAAARGGQFGDFSIASGGAKQTQTMWIVLGAVVVFVVMARLAMRRR